MVTLGDPETNDLTALVMPAFSTTMIPPLLTLMGTLAAAHSPRYGARAASGRISFDAM